PQRIMLFMDAQAGLLSTLRPILTRILATARAARPSPYIFHVLNADNSGDVDEPGAAGWQLDFAPRVHTSNTDKRKDNVFSGTRLRLGELLPPDAETVIVGLQLDLSVRASECLSAFLPSSMPPSHPLLLIGSEVWLEHDIQRPLPVIEDMKNAPGPDF
ncbi:hypothetical protein B0H11DRAFT_1710995, partial [Mycena galericulata]